MTNKAEIIALIARHLDNPDDKDCKLLVDNYRQQSAENEALFKEMEKVWYLSEQAAVLERIDDKAAALRFSKRLAIPLKDEIKKEQPAKVRLFVRWTSVAAAFLVITTVAYWFVSKTPINKKEKVYAADANPGGNKAVLVLADGRKISLTDVNNGDIVKQVGLSITKTADGQLVYNVANVNLGKELDDAFNTIETPKGGMWQVRLPDGSLVWLNAASSLTYPLSFSKGHKRMVELKGEAYFEVVKDKLHPFIVKTDRQEVEVLGTHFNVNAYADEVVVKTTLLEGSVKVNSLQADGTTEILKPGEQSVLTLKGLGIKQVDAEGAIDWKNGYFMFDNEQQESIMRKIARWYNLEVEYADIAAKHITYYGSISRFENVSKVLRKFEQTGEVRFELTKNKIIVYKASND